MKLDLSYRKALGKLFSAFLILIIVAYYLTTCSTISSRSIESVGNTIWYANDLTVSFELNKGVIFDDFKSENFDYIESNGYIFAFYVGTLDDKNSMPIYEFTNLGERLYCSTNNIMFYSERVVYQ